MDTAFFSKENSVNSYYAGFIAADGCVDKNSNRISIRINKKDINILINLKKDMNISNNIRIYKSLNSDMAELSFSDQNIKQDLEKLFNITPNKSLTLKSPNILEEQNIKNYIIGYIDGDGCVGFYFREKINRVVPSITIVGTFEIIKWIIDIFSKYLNDDYSKCLYKRKEHKNNTFIFTCTDRKAVNVIKFLSPKTVSFFNRKWTEEILNYCVNYKDVKKKVLKLNKDNLNIIEEFNSVIDAAKSVKTQPTNISKCCKNIKYSSKNFKWCYKYDKN